jgi:hypothetical protein
MTKTTIVGLLAGLALAVAVMPSFGCGGGGGGGVIEELCERGVECDVAPTYGQCVDYMETCTDDLTDSQREQWFEQIDECLELSTCGAMVDCYNQVPWC